MTRGGYRPNAGRKKGFSSLEAEKAREFIAQRLTTDLEPIIAKAIEQAKEGDHKAREWLTDRAYGKSFQATATEISGTDGKQIVFMPLELIKKHDMPTE